MLHIVQDGQKNDDDDDDGDGIPSQTGANVSFRSIIDHLCSRHSMSLRILDMKNAYVDVKSLKKLFTSCKVVEEVYLCTGRHVLVCQIFTFVTCQRGIYFMSVALDIDDFQEAQCITYTTPYRILQHQEHQAEQVACY